MIGAEQIEARAAHSAEHKAWGLADALVGADGPAATLQYLRLRQQGERLAGLTYMMAGRLREALAVSLRLSAGESVAEVKRSLRMPRGRPSGSSPTSLAATPSACAGPWGSWRRWSSTAAAARRCPRGATRCGDGRGHDRPAGDRVIAATA